MTYAEGGITPTAEFLEPPLWVITGTLDRDAFRQLRHLLHQSAARQATSVVIDLASLEVSQELTMLTLLAEAATSLALNGSTLIALSPPSRLVTEMAACGIRVIPNGPLPPLPPGTLRITIGALAPTHRSDLTPPVSVAPQARTPALREPYRPSGEPRGGQAPGVSEDTSIERPAPAAPPNRSMPCVYCREAIPAATFTFTSTARRLVAARCPSCQRQVTLGTATWRRWSRMPDPV